MTPPNFSKVPTEIVEKWADYLEDEDLACFRLACRQADAQTLHTTAQRFFSTWRTCLMGSDMKKLEDISLRTDLRDHVKHIIINDDCEKNDPQWRLVNPQDVPPTPLTHFWPRDGAQIVDSSSIGVATFKTMLIDKRFHPETITIRDFRSGNGPLNPEPVNTLAKDLLDGANLAITSITFVRESSSVTSATFHFSPQHQGQYIGFSMLRSADLYLASNAASYWSEQVLYHAPNLESLRLAYFTPWNADHDLILSAGKPIVKLRQLHIYSSELTAHAVSSILVNSKHTLTEISFRLTNLMGSRWSELFSDIADDFPELTSFSLTNLSQDHDSIRFQGFGENSVEEEYRSGLELFKTGPKDKRRLPKLRYNGSGAGTVLKIVAAYAATS